MAPDPPIEQDLFPEGRPATPEQVASVLDQYKLLVQTTESLESRRQTLHTFFMSINSLLLAAIGLIGKESLDTPTVGVGVVMLGVTGVVMSVSWLQQIHSHGRVASSKWEVINHIERVLPSQPFCAEWQALQRRAYRSFTDIECLVPQVFITLYVISVMSGGLLLADII